eukprot:Tamp_17935.p1 GENE.Tamp_17935~~Tamp_17935.p1  ORF type:complete len:364 (+),score=49.15 Tamp_17935:55-1092(+)
MPALRASRGNLRALAALLPVLLAADAGAAGGATRCAFVGAEGLRLPGPAPWTHQAVTRRKAITPGLLAALVPAQGQRSPLRLRGGALFSFSRPTRTAFTSVNVAGTVVQQSGGEREEKGVATSADLVADRPRVVFILGGPGSGKGTQCSLLTENFRSVTHLSAGDLLRAERDSGSEQGDMINAYMKEGKIIPVAVTAGLLKKAIEGQRGKSEVFLIDGFPRNDDNLRGWNEIVGDSVQVEFMLLMECSEEVMLSRLIQRGAGSGRVDDNEDTIRKRFHVYKTETLPVVSYFDNESRLLRISADQDRAAVFADIEKVFSKVATKKSLVRRIGGKLRRSLLPLLGRS